MRGFRIEFVARSRQPAAWALLALAVGFLAWSWNRFEEQSDAARLANVEALAKQPATINDPRQAQNEADAGARRQALGYPWLTILAELEALPDENTSVLRFEHLRGDGTTRVTVQTRDFGSLERSLARVRKVAPATQQWRIVSTSRDTTDALHPLRVELAAASPLRDRRISELP